MSSALRVPVPLNSMCSTKCAIPPALVGLVPRPARQPHADRHRTYMRHRLGDEPEPAVEHFADNHRLGMRPYRHTRGIAPARSVVDSKRLAELATSEFQDARRIAGRTDSQVACRNGLNAHANQETSRDGRDSVHSRRTISVRTVKDRAHGMTTTDTRHGRARTRRARADLDALGHAALPRPADLPVDLSAAESPTSRPMTDLGRELRARAPRSSSSSTTPAVIQREHSVDGTTQVPAAARRRQAHRVGLHPRHAGA